VSQPAQPMPDPFGAPQAPWWRRLWRRERAESAPRRYLVPATILGGIAGLALPPMHGRIEGDVLLGLVTLLPPVLVNMWWKQRRRQASEQLLVFPEAGGAESDRP